MAYKLMSERGHVAVTAADKVFYCETVSDLEEITGAEFGDKALIVGNGGNRKDVGRLFVFGSTGAWVEQWGEDNG